VVLVVTVVMGLDGDSSNGGGGGGSTEETC